MLRAHLANRPLDRDPFPTAAALAERLTAAAYPVIAFSAADLQSEPQPDLAIRALAALVRQLNDRGRAALLPLGGADGESSAHQVSAWHTGYSIRQQFQRGVPRYEPRRGDARRLLDSDGADLLLWISPLNHEPPPVTSVPTLVFGHPGMTLEREPEVFIPLAVPGVHRAGAIHRGDGVATAAALGARREQPAGQRRCLRPTARPLGTDKGTGKTTMLTLLKGARLFDPANGIRGEVGDIWVERHSHLPAAGGAVPRRPDHRPQPAAC